MNFVMFEAIMKYEIKAHFKPDNCQLVYLIHRLEITHVKKIKITQFIKIYEIATRTGGMSKLHIDKTAL